MQYYVPFFNDPHIQFEFDPVISKSEPISRCVVIDGERANIPSITAHVNVSPEKQTPGKTEGP